MLCVCLLFFVKQNTTYELRISDWTSDVCSSYLSSGTAFTETVSLAALAANSFATTASVGSTTSQLAFFAFSRIALAVPAMSCSQSSDELSVGNACVSTFRSRWCQSH